MTHDDWFEQKIKEAIRESDDPNTVWISQDEIIKSSKKRRAELLDKTLSVFHPPADIPYLVNEKLFKEYIKNN